MPKQCAATDEDWVLVEQLWRAGATWAECRRAIDGRASDPTIKRRAEAGGWVRSGNGLSAHPTVPELQNARKQIQEITLLSWAEKREAMISKLIERADHLLDRMVQPHTHIEVKTVSGGKDMGGSVEIVEVPLSQPVPGDQQRLMTSAAIAIDKIQLLAGEATSRNEHIEGTDRDGAVARAAQMRDEVAARREAREAAEAETPAVAEA